MSLDDRPFVDRFTETNHEPFNYKGLTVQDSLRLSVNKESRLFIKVLSVVRKPKQGLAISGVRCKVHIAGQTVRDAVCWIDRLPYDFEVNFRAAKPDAEVVIWNTFKLSITPHPLPDIGDNGMVVDRLSEQENRFIVRCNSGADTKKDFKSLVFELKLN